jgi:hypothetical protein
MGESAKMVVIGTACLHPAGQAMGQDGCIQKKSPLLAESAITEIVSVSRSRSSAVDWFVAIDGILTYVTPSECRNYMIFMCILIITSPND